MSRPNLVGGGPAQTYSLIGAHGVHPNPLTVVNKAAPYSASSPWNTPTPAGQSWFDTTLLHNSYAGNFWWVQTTWTGIYWTSPTDPTWSVVLPDYKPGIGWDRTRTATSFQIQAPTTMVVDNGGSDYQLCIADPVSGDELNVWHAQVDNTNRIISTRNDSSQGGVTGTSTATSATTLTDSTQAWTTNRFNDGINRQVIICGNAWAPIQSNTGTVITVTAWLQVGSTATYSDGAGHAFPPNPTAYQISSRQAGWGRTNMITGTGAGVSDGNNPGSRAANTTLAAGLLTQADWDAGVINHALAIAVNNAEMYPGGTTNFVSPATAGDPAGGGGSGALLCGTKIGIPAGQTMPPILTTLVDGKPVGAWIWNCLQTYGGYVVDVTGGSTSFYADDKLMPTGQWEAIYAWWNNYYGTSLAAMDVIKPYLRIGTAAHA